MAKAMNKLIDLEIPNGLIVQEESKDADELIRARSDYNTSMSIKKKEIQEKINALEKKLQKHSLKEGMLDKIINMTYTELENLKENEFTRRGQKQSILIKQLEALSILHDTILKYEDTIQKYQKILIDLENNKLNSYIKVENLRKEEKVSDDSITEVLAMIQEQIVAGSSGVASNPLLDEIQQELENDNYR
jgi:hypothetical protein